MLTFNLLNIHTFKTFLPAAPHCGLHSELPFKISRFYNFLNIDTINYKLKRDLVDLVV